MRLMGKHSFALIGFVGVLGFAAAALPADSLKVTMAPQSGSGESDEATLKLHRGFPDDEWAAARAGLVERGWLDADGRLTARGAAEHEAVEAATDAAAEQPWRAIGGTATARLRDLLDPVASRIRTSGLIPHPNPLGMPQPIP